jgi:hypothetical protein
MVFKKMKFSFRAATLHGWEQEIAASSGPLPFAPLKSARESEAKPEAARPPLPGGEGGQAPSPRSSESSTIAHSGSLRPGQVRSGSASVALKPAPISRSLALEERAQSAPQTPSLQRAQIMSAPLSPAANQIAQAAPSPEPAPATEAAPPVIGTVEEYNRLPPGTLFVWAKNHRHYRAHMNISR